MRIFMSAGEASGDLLGGRLLHALHALHEGSEGPIEASGMGGPAMVQAGLTAHRSAAELSVVGLVEVARHLPRLLALKEDLAARAIRDRPDVAVLIDAPDFHLRLASQLARAGIPVVFYVAPQVWAWRPRRVHTFARVARRILVLFEFELEGWRAAGVDVRWVGHPLADEIPEAAPLEAIRERTVALLPGSRRVEVERHLDTLLAAAAMLVERGVADRFVVPLAPMLPRELVAARVGRSKVGRAVEIEIAGGDPELRRAAIASCSAALVASGTATLETALIGRPQVIFYRVNALSWLVGRPLLRVERVGLANLVAGRDVAPELLQGAFTAAAAAAAVERVMAPGAARSAALEGAAAVRAALGPPGASRRAAEAVLEIARSPAL